MSLFHLAAVLIPLIAVLGYLNHRLLKLPDALGIMALGVVLSAVLSVSALWVPELTERARNIVEAIDFSETVFHGMLGLLLFAGSLHVSVARLARQALPILALATVGVVISMFAVGLSLHWTLAAAGVHVGLVYCLLFGALISPTDPIAVLGVLKKAGVPQSLENAITGESLFNDGTAVVAFLAALAVAKGAADPSFATIGTMLAREIVGGVALGLACGYAAFLLLKGIESYPVEILVTLALPISGYALAEALHVSAPLAVVVMGLVIGNHGVRAVMSEKTREHLFQFWDLIDELLNLVLFGLMGLMLLSLEVPLQTALLSLVAIPLVLAARWASVVAPLAVLRPVSGAIPGAGPVMTWGGLRGGISLALVLSLPEFSGKPLILCATYAVVVFSLLVQATTLPMLLRRLELCRPGAAQGACP